MQRLGWIGRRSSRFSSHAASPSRAESCLVLLNAIHESRLDIIYILTYDIYLWYLIFTALHCTARHSTALHCTARSIRTIDDSTSSQRHLNMAGSVARFCRCHDNVPHSPALGGCSLSSTTSSAPAATSHASRDSEPQQVLRRRHRAFPWHERPKGSR